jgi:hypothetical protein
LRKTQLNGEDKAAFFFLFFRFVLLFLLFLSLTKEWEDKLQFKVTEMRVLCLATDKYSEMSVCHGLLTAGIHSA